MSMFKDSSGFIIHLPDAEIPESVDLLFDAEEQEELLGDEFAELLSTWERLMEGSNHGD